MRALGPQALWRGWRKTSIPASNCPEKQPPCSAIMLEPRTRAYLGVFEGPFISQNPETGFRLEFRLVIRNTGFSPARGVVFASEARIMPSPLPSDIDLTVPIEQIQEGGATINASQEFTMRSILDHVMNSDEVAGVTSQMTPLIYIFGRIEYRDVFDERHYTHFCKIVLWNGPQNVFYINTSRHNDSN